MHTIQPACVIIHNLSGSPARRWKAGGWSEVAPCYLPDLPPPRHVSTIWGSACLCVCEHKPDWSLFNTQPGSAAL